MTRGFRRSSEGLFDRASVRPPLTYRAMAGRAGGLACGEALRAGADTRPSHEGWWSPVGRGSGCGRSDLPRQFTGTKSAARRLFRVRARGWDSGWVLRGVNAGPANAFRTAADHGGRRPHCGQSRQIRPAATDAGNSTRAAAGSGAVLRGARRLRRKGARASPSGKDPAARSGGEAWGMVPFGDSCVHAYVSKVL